MPDGQHDRSLEPQAKPTSTRRYFVDARAQRRSRWLILLLVVNWLLMGWLLLAAGGERPLLAGFAFLAGLFVFAGAVSQLRALRLAESVALIETSPKTIRYRRYSSSHVEEVAWSAVASWRPLGDVIEVDLRASGESSDLIRPIGLHGLAAEQRESLLAEVRQHLGAPTARG